VKPHNFEGFLKRVWNASKELEGLKSEERLDIDAEIPASYMTPELITVVEMLEPYGEEHRPLQFLLRNAVLQEVTVMGSGNVRHLRLLVRTGTLAWPAVFWRAGDRLDMDFALGDHVDMVFRLGRNYFKNTETLQLTVLDLMRTGEASIEG